MIAVDTSALVAISQREPAAEALARTLIASGQGVCTAVAYVETGVVLAGSKQRGGDAIRDIEGLLRYFAIDIVPVDAELARLALDARIRFGKGFGHPAQLSFGDSFSYALAKKLNAPLLFVGADFALTDVAPALR